jgi:enoyl-CoA hydratase
MAAIGPERLMRCAPSSLYAIHASHLAARNMVTVHEVLNLDLALARVMARWPDFAEGVRAVLVDKDRQPQWSAEIKHIAELIRSAIGPELV